MRVVRLLIRGRVQGVGFRVFVEDEANRRWLVGWVRNRRDGSVEAVIGGMPATVQEMIETCRKGPAGAAVRTIEVEDVSEEALSARPPGERFSVLPTG